MKKVQLHYEMEDRIVQLIPELMIIHILPRKRKKQMKKHISKELVRVFREYVNNDRELI